MTRVIRDCKIDHTDPMFIAMMATANLRPSDKLEDRLEGFTHVMEQYHRFRFDDIGEMLVQSFLIHDRWIGFAIRSPGNNNPEGPGLFMTHYDKNLTLVEVAREFFEKFIHAMDDMKAQEFVENLISEIKIGANDAPEFDV